MGGDKTTRKNISEINYERKNMRKLLSRRGKEAEVQLIKEEANLINKRNIDKQNQNY